MSLSEQDIAAGCLKGDRSAQKLLYETYGEYLFAVCYRYLGNREEAEDLLHDGFIKIFTHFEQFVWKGEGSLKAWTDQVMRNTVLMYMRNQRYWLDTIELEEATMIEDSEPENAFDIPYEVILEMIAELPPQSRVIFNLYVIDGHSHQEIAQMLGIKEKASSSQLAKAKKAIAGKINKWRENNL